MRTSEQREYVRRLAGRLGKELYTRAEVAEALGLPEGTLQRWAERSPNGQHLGPDYKTDFRGRWIYVYTPDSVTRIREWRDFHTRWKAPTGRKRAGRPSMWNAEEAADRNRRSRAASGRHKRADELDVLGRHAEAAVERREGDRLRAALREEAAQRRELIRLSRGES